MELNTKQDIAVRLAKSWFKMFNDHVFILAGYAGTGKTLTAQAIADKITESNHGYVAYVAFTGKAALVMRQRGMPATTIHHLIYNVDTEIVPTPAGPRKRIVSTLKEKLDPRPSLIIIDEVSMVGEKIWDDLLSFNIPIIAIGDPFQLPPVCDSQTKLLDDPDIVLDEIVRQGKGSSITILADKVRRGMPIYEDDMTDNIYQVPKSYINTDLAEMLKWSNQIIAARNSSVADINEKARIVLGYSDMDMPENGEKLICKRNDWTQVIDCNDMEYALVNGMIGSSSNVKKVKHDLTLPWKTNKDTATYMYYMDFIPSFDMEHRFEHIPFNHQSLFVSKEQSRWSKSMIFNFAYCITCHAAQGSEWDNVILYDDSWPDGNDELFQARWRYTGITRAKKNLIWMR